MAKTMNAIGFTDHLPITDEHSLQDFTEAVPVAKGHDLLVHVSAVSVNPVDIGVRRGGRGHLSQPRVIGWDAVGEVVAVGGQVQLFNVGDRVYYAGSFKRAGSDSDYQLVDERIVGHAPQHLSDVEAAAMPLTTLAAWEALFEQLPIDPDDKENNAKYNLLIINGAGGVGSIATQLAHWAGLHVIATASRPETIDWTLAHGANETVNHREDLVKQVRNLGYHYVDYILELNNLDAHWNEMAELIEPSGWIASITENHRPVDLKRLTQKRGHFAWEWMYTKSFFHTADMQTQHDILERAAKMFDDGTLKSTLTKQLSPFDAATLRQAHTLVESGHMMGKVVVTR